MVLFKSTGGTTSATYPCASLAPEVDPSNVYNSEIPFKVAPHVALKISLCAKNEKEDLRLASKECALASSVLSQMTTSSTPPICASRDLLT